MTTNYLITVSIIFAAGAAVSEFQARRLRLVNGPSYELWEMVMLARLLLIASGIVAIAAVVGGLR